MKKNILHLIDSLARGGAEILLSGIVNDLDEYNNIVVYLNEPSELKTEFKNCKTTICLGHQGIKTIPRTIYRLKKIIKEENVHLVHSHLFWSTLIARLSTPGDLPMIYSIHSFLGKDPFEKSKLSLLAEKLSYSKKQYLISTSYAALDDYKNYIPTGKNCWVIHNYVNDVYFKKDPKVFKTNNKTLRLVAVGNLKEAKNYPYLLKAFEHLKKLNVHLDIYGEGYLRKSFEQIIKEKELKITLKGSVNNIQDYLKDYDAFVMSSSYEGFGIAVAEAMASGLPVLLSQISVFKEVANDSAIFFDLNDPMDFVKKIESILNSNIDLNRYAEKGQQRSNEIYRKSAYMQKLKNVYQLALENNQILCAE